jgi:alpha-L-fucosidase
MIIRIVIFPVALIALMALMRRPVFIEPPSPVYPVPSQKQLDYHEMEMNAFVHFTTNTFTDLEWGMGDEKPAIFNPTAFDARQWTKVVKEAGFKGLILTTKHHDGFCLWPTKYSEHSVKNSPFKNGKGDVVKEVSAACKVDGLKFGVYLSPWDRNRADYGSSTYIDYYRNQLKELFTQYGPVFEMWFDGANGGKGYYGGANETRKINSAVYYDWPNTLETVRKIQPNVLFFSDAGPDIRWVGNERGTAGTTNWNTISNDTLYAGKPGIERLLNTGSEDGDKWIPAEVDVSIRPGWFYHKKEDSLVKSAENLFRIYLSSVGRGSTLLLNLPPDRRGIIHENDIEALKGFRKMLDTEFKTNLASKGSITANQTRGNDRAYAPSNLNDKKKDTYWATNDGVNTAEIEIDLGQMQTVKYILLQEYIKLGQRVKSFSVESYENGGWKEVTTGTTIGYKRILPVPSIKTSKLKIRIKDSRSSPVLSNLEVY